MTRIHALGLGLLLGLMALASSGAGAQQQPAPAPDDSALNAEVEALKRDVLELNRELFILEEELLFPSSTQVQFFLSLDVGEFFALDAVKLEVNGEPVAAHLYTPQELEALRRGAVQRLHTANLARGKHPVMAVFTGKGPNGRDYRRAAETTVDKGLGPQYLELRIRDSEARQQPEFDIRRWE